MNKMKDMTDEFLESINVEDKKLLDQYEKQIVVDEALTRKIVSFQANKKQPSYRWYKYKEAFSSDLVKLLLNRYEISKGIIFDPFCGAGTALFASLDAGLDADGIELLPVGHEIVENRYNILRRLKEKDVAVIEKWIEKKPWNKKRTHKELNYLRITKGAYSDETEKKIGKYLLAIESENEVLRGVLFFALLCILESISFTRKDGQYLRWDYRSGRRKGQNKFNKGKVYEFDEAIVLKLNDIVNDITGKNSQLSLFKQKEHTNTILNLHKGSCLDIISKLPRNNYDAIITSPPYCNRYDYTRTYALEHAMLDIQEDELVQLRQTMLSCTVENKEKALLEFDPEWKKAIEVSDNLNLLQLIIEYLEYKKSVKELNNNGIPRMVKGYFYEMACVIQDCHKVLKNGGRFFMVNDNVRYAGASISVDLILSSMAESLGFEIEKILVLPNGKGNSSQQMGNHGRVALRKCVYVWRKN